MAVGAKTKMDKKLVSLYTGKQTTNFDTKSSIDPEVIWQGMTVIAMNNKAFLNINNANIA